MGVRGDSEHLDSLTTPIGLIRKDIKSYGAIYRISSVIYI
jgi:hypothetical protein